MTAYVCAELCSGARIMDNEEVWRAMEQWEGSMERAVGLLESIARCPGSSRERLHGLADRFELLDRRAAVETDVLRTMEARSHFGGDAPQDVFRQR